MYNVIKKIMLEAIQYPRPHKVQNVCLPIWNQPFFYKIDKAKALTISYNPTDKGAQANYNEQLQEYQKGNDLSAEEIFDILYNFKKEDYWRKNFDLIFNVLGVPSEDIAHMDASFFPYQTFNDFQNNKGIDDTYKFLYKTIELLSNQLEYIFIDGAKNSDILNYLIKDYKLIECTAMSINSGKKYTLSIYKHKEFQTILIYLGCALYGQTCPSENYIKNIAAHIKTTVFNLSNQHEPTNTIKIDDDLLNSLRQYRDKTIELRKTKTFFVVSDIRCSGYELEKLLEENGFDKQNPAHIVVTCGSILTSGYAIEDFNSPFEFLLSLHDFSEIYNRLILIKNNDDEAIINTIDKLIAYKDFDENGDHLFNELNKDDAISHIAKLIGCTTKLFWRYRKTLISEFEQSHILLTLKEYAVNYYEIDNYTLVHGGIPRDRNSKEPMKTWRNCDNSLWSESFDDCIYNGILSEPQRIIVTSHGVEPWSRVLDYHRTNTLPHKNGNHIIIHSDLGTNCIVLKQDSKGKVEQILGTVPIGYFWVVDNNILSHKKTINLDRMSLPRTGVLKPTGDIIEVWEKLSQKYKKGKYAKLPFNHFCYGEVVYDYETLNSKICFHKFLCGEIVRTEILFDCIYEIDYKDDKKSVNLNIDKIKDVFNIRNDNFEFDKLKDK